MMTDYEKQQLEKLDKISDQIRWGNNWLWMVFATLCMIYLKMQGL